ncbi:K02A2.6-like, partial [Cordylochernes scorpioides]
MDGLLKGLRWTICLCYLDDVVVFADNFSDHLARIETVLNCFKKVGLRLNPSKCSFGASKIKILGHQVDQNGIRPDEEKIKAITEFQAPNNLQQVRSFLCLSSYRLGPPIPEPNNDPEIPGFCSKNPGITEATVKFLLEELQAQSHSLSKDLQKSFQKRILEERCNKTSLVLQYLHNPQAQLEKKKMVKDFSVKLILRLKPLQEQMAEVKKKKIQADNSQLPRSLQERHEPSQSNDHLTIERRLQEAIEAASSTSIAIPTPDSASYSTMINHELNIAAQSGKQGPHLESVYQYLLTIPPTKTKMFFNPGIEKKAIPNPGIENMYRDWKPYYRRFIRNYADIARPLNALLSKGTKFEWNTAQEGAFRKLKIALTSKPVLGHFDDDAPTELHTDASGYGIGAVLAQKQGSDEKVIAYASRTLLRAEQNYSTTERECLAIIWAIGKFRPYLFGRHFRVVTDHHSLCWLTNLKDPAGRLARWALRLQEYDVSIVYKTGRMHQDADGLSRNPLKHTEENFNDDIPTLFLQSDIGIEQENDPYIAEIIRNISQPSLTKQDDKFKIVKGILYRKNYDPTEQPLLLVVPRHLRMEILSDLHDAPTAGHLGFAITYDRVKRRFYWPGLYRSVKRYVGHCQDCQRRKGVPQLPPGYLKPIPPPDSPFQKVGIDLLGRFPISQGKKKWIVVCTDCAEFFFKRIPFGITSAPEIFQRKMTQLLGNIEGVVCFMDDIVVYGSSLEEHNERVRQVLKKIQEERMTLNPEKCQFGVKTVKFLGHTLSSEGLFIDEEKLDAITKMEAPRSTKELKSFLGMMNYLGKFIPNLADKLQPLNSLLSTKNEWVWDEPQKKSFNLLKQELVSRPNLALFDPSRTTIVSADASSFGIGGVLRQEQPDGSLKPIAYVSRTLSETEKRYSQIEKEGLAIVWTCERLKDYVTGIKIHIETDHKPLIAIFTSKSLEDMTPRLQRLKMRMMRYSYQISHIAGKKQIVADMLSRKPMSKPHKDELEEELSAYIQSIEFPATEERLLEISRKQKEDSLCSQLAKYCMSGWPKNKREVDPELRGYWQFQEDLTYQNGLLLRGQRILIPKTLRKDILEKLHQGHFGINKCRSRAKESVWWLGISQEIERMVSSCTKCLKERKPKHEPLMPSEFPIRPWQKVGMDLFYLNGRWYLIVCDYYSRYPEISLLQNLTAQEVIGRLKSIFARHGTPETVRSDNGPQFQKVLGSEFSKFSKEWSFKHITSSPKFPQSNGFIEAIIKNIKQSFKKEEDCYLTLQAYRTMPLESGYSPAELLMGRRLRTSVPAIESSLMPRYLDSEALQEREKRRVINQKRLYDKRHDVHSLPQLQQGDSVWVRDQRVKGERKVLHKSEEPRSYWVQTPQGKVRRNRLHLTPLPKMGSTMDASEDDQDDQEQETEEDCPTPTASSTRDGRMQRDNQDQEPEKSLPSMPAVHTRYGRAVKIPRSLGSGEAQEIAKFLLEEVILKHGAPREIVMDRGRNFQPKLLQELINKCGIKKKTTTAYHPQTNSLTERLNRTIADMLSMYMDLDQKNWDEMLPFITFAYNTAKQESTGFTPFFLIHGREAETTLDTIFPYSSLSEGEEFIKNLGTRAEEARQIAHHIFKAQEMNKTNYGARHTGKIYEPGDLVWIFIPIRRVGFSEKLQRRYFSPFRVTKKILDVTYEVEAVSEQ